MRVSSERQLRFCDLVAGGEPAGRAYEKAGYKARGAVADQAASRLLRNVKVAERIRELQAENREASRIDRRKGLDFLCDILETPIGEVGPSHVLCQEYRELGNSGGRVVKMPSKLDAFDKLAKMCGWYEPEKKEHRIVDPLASLLKQIRGSQESVG